MGDYMLSVFVMFIYCLIGKAISRFGKRALCDYDGTWAYLFVFGWPVILLGIIFVEDMFEWKE
jgi:hypothetical protein